MRKSETVALNINYKVHLSLRQVTLNDNVYYVIK
jgi:hypothetical protein